MGVCAAMNEKPLKGNDNIWPCPHWGFNHYGGPHRGGVLVAHHYFCEVPPVAEGLPWKERKCNILACLKGVTVAVVVLSLFTRLLLQGLQASR